MIGQAKQTSLKLKRVFIEYNLPASLAPLNDIANNLWWSWNKDATELFRSIDPGSWESNNYNPIAQIDQMTVERTRELAKDQAFLAKLDQVNTDFRRYMEEAPAPDAANIAYFCMEYGLHYSVRLYSGGLGILAGDFLKEASDMNMRMVGVGLLYRYGYFQQSISLHGDQISNYPPQKFTQLPIVPVRDDSGEWLKVSVDLPGRKVHAKIWKLSVGRIPLYLLDADLDENEWEDRSLTHQLYGGNNEHRLKQEMLLGIGGMRALEALGHEADVYHLNEGHAAFLGLERLRKLIVGDGLSFDQALEVVRPSSLFTTHTPVPAGHDHFPEALLRGYFTDYVEDLGITWERFVGLGRIQADNFDEDFSMSHLAIRLSEEVNGVSKLHGAVSRSMFRGLYPGYHADELHIGHVTNSVHYPTWVANDWNELYKETFGADFLKDQSNKDYWRKIYNLPDELIVQTHDQQKQRLLEYVKAKLQEDLTRRGEKPAAIFEVLNHIRKDALILGFARRFATYKRAHLLFTNTERLAEIVNDPERPVMFIFAGKAHPADRGGQDLIKQILHISKQPDFQGKVIFLEGYNIEMAKLLVRGVDIWLNTPTRPKEASGTSGMKAVLNGVLNFSVLDGWWAEGYRPDAGWALPRERTYDDQRLQDELDAETIYNILENDIVETYFDRNGAGYSERWVQLMKHNIAEVAPTFTMKRMMDDYVERYYSKLHQRSQKFKADAFDVARKMAAWKADMRRQWDELEVLDIDMSDTDNFALTVGQNFRARLKVYLNGIDPENVGLEVVFFRRREMDDSLQLRLTRPLELEKTEDGNIAYYTCQLELEMSGVFEYGFRLFATHPLLAHRQEIDLVTWI